MSAATSRPSSRRRNPLRPPAMAGRRSILSDSLNRHYLPTYGNQWVIAPNIERFARRSVVFLVMQSLDNAITFRAKKRWFGKGVRLTTEQDPEKPNPVAV